MKNQIAFLALLLFAILPQSSFSNPDSGLAKINTDINDLRKSQTSVETSVTDLKKKIDEQLASIKSSPAVKKCDNTVMIVERIISFLPVALFAIITLLIFSRLKKEGFKIGDTLKEKEKIENKQTIVSKDVAGIVSGTQETTNTDAESPKSSSRVISFISAMITLTIASCISTYWIYKSFKCDDPVDLSGLSTVLLALGLGVIPYGFNKIGKAIGG